MQKILDVVREYFQEEGINFFQIEDKPALALNMTGANGQLQCFAATDEDSEHFLFYSVLPVKAPEAKRAALAEFVARANYGLIVGNFELDFQDGGIRFKTSICTIGDRLSPALVRNLVGFNVCTVDKFLPGVMGVLYGQLSPEQAHERVLTESTEKTEQEAAHPSAPPSFWERLLGR
jgi:hypothetical protein